MQTIHLNFSIDRILQNIYALSAMHSYANHHTLSIPILNPDRAKALRILVGNSFSLLVSHFAKSIQSCRLPAETLDFTPQQPDIMELQLIVTDRFNPDNTTSLLKIAELFVVYVTLAEIYDTPLPAIAAQYEHKARQCIERLAATTIDTPTCLRISPHFL